ncbi:hypothetical protein O3M35_000861 [Rhynocoris fuscipes]|uniref:Uncharacterized protein n=1 Tax=Rhynocoris fuscipes TaxID=488301 RepID=A0AAW1DTG3_9HEMI
MSSQYTIIIFVIFTVSYSSVCGDDAEENIQKGLEVLKMCQKEHSVPDSQLAGIFLFSNVPGSQNAKCMLSCLLKGIGFTKEGKPDIDEIKIHHREMFPNERHQKLADANAEKCISQLKSEEECDLAFELVRCIMRQAARTGLPPPSWKKPSNK